MDRKTCYMAPTFDLARLHRGQRVHYILRNRKGVIKYQGVGTVVLNRGDFCRVEPEKHPAYPNSFPLPLHIWAKDVYHGKTNLKILDEGGK